MNKKYSDILKQYWGYDSFRPLQEDIISSIAQGKDTLGLMPTGGGKSITFQVPALAVEGVCVVVTPLIALMKDQVSNLRKRGIKATAIYSGMNRAEVVTALENCIFGDYKLLYISPERLDSEIFQKKLVKMPLSFITVDESHCISQWGYDFRPAYLKIADIRTLVPHVPVLALTATATPQVIKDIQEKLCFKQENVFQMSFERRNLAYLVRHTDNKPAELLKILNRVSGSAIVYVRNRRRAKETAEWLVKEGVTADFYHAGIDNAVKDLRQKRWQGDEVRVMVATNAFGMGIDKPDVRLVVHLDVPDSPESYFQEAGRAGRDGKKAFAVMLYAASDRTLLHKRVNDNFPEKEYIREVYEHLQYFFQMAMGDGLNCVKEFDLEQFCLRFKHFPIRVDSALKILSRAGYLEYTEEQDSSSRLRFLLRREDLYKIGAMDADMEQLIQTLLRQYSGVFIDHTYISEQSLAVYTGLTVDRVYQMLKLLSRRRIIDYIPRKKIPYIIYTRERIDERFIQLAPEVYEERKQSFQTRIAAIENYVTTQHICRSRLLLNYFGERNEHNCGMCDVCLSEKLSRTLNEEEYNRLAAQIVERIAKKPLTPASLAGSLQARKEDIAYVVRYLADTGSLILYDGLIGLPDKKEG
ncbi:MAG: ATP-dependent DNA helicase RecQ [Bacteroides sp.]|nr:ATP-dependent DNA helicase RecQ [Bacteroides sp.]